MNGGPLALSKGYASVCVINAYGILNTSSRGSKYIVHRSVRVQGMGVASTTPSCPPPNPSIKLPRTSILLKTITKTQISWLFMYKDLAHLVIEKMSMNRCHFSKKFFVLFLSFPENIFRVIKLKVHHSVH